MNYCRGIDGATFVRVVRCDCGKVHCCAGISPGSRCTCDRRLWEQVWSKGR